MSSLSLYMLLLLLKVPTEQDIDATVVVPLDRRGKKTLTDTKRLPVANFRGEE